MTCIRTHATGGLSLAAGVGKATLHGLSSGFDSISRGVDRVHGGSVRHERAANWSDGVAKGAVSIAGGLVRGIGGVVMDPVRGARKSGVKGFLKGAGTGVLGLVTRPVSGVVSGAARVMEGTKNANQTGAVKDILQTLVRFPRPVYGRNRCIRSLDPIGARYFALYRSKAGKLSDTSTVGLVAVHQMGAQGQIVVLTTMHLMVLNCWGAVQWFAAIDDSTRIVLEHAVGGGEADGLCIHLQRGTTQTEFTVRSQGEASLADVDALYERLSAGLGDTWDHVIE